MERDVALDTNAYTALGRGNESLAQLISKAPQIGLPIIVLGEIYHGIYHGNSRTKNETILNKFLTGNRIELLYIDKTTAKLFGEMATELKRLGKVLQQNDIWIAALCKQHDYALITADQGFSFVIGLELVNF